MIDPSIAAADSAVPPCLYIDDPKPSPYYLSPNVIMTTKPSDPSDVYPNANTTSVSVSWRADCAISNELAIIFDLYIGDPTLPMIPGSTLSPIVQAYPPPNGLNISPGQLNVVTSVSWNTTSATILQHLTQPHHACLIARVYPFGATPDTGDLTGYPADDLHYAQHNCTVLTTDGAGKISFPIVNGILDREPRFVSVHAVPDLEPTRATLEAVLPRLQSVPGFKKIAARPLPGVQFDFGAFKGPHDSLLERLEPSLKPSVIDLIREREGETEKAKGVSTRAVLPPNFFGKFNFTADLSATEPGEAYIVQITQIDGNGDPYGGLAAAIMRQS